MMQNKAISHVQICYQGGPMTYALLLLYKAQTILPVSTFVNCLLALRNESNTDP